MISAQQLKLCVKGDRKAQRAFYQAFAKKMLGHCHRYVKSIPDAEDVLLEGFLKVYQNLSGFEYRDEKSLEAWVRKIMVREALQHLRRRNAFDFASIEEADEVTAEWSGDSDLAAEEIYQLIRRLPAGYRIIFNLYVVEGYSHAEIAVLLHIAESTSRSQLSKAKTVLQGLLLENGIRYGG